MNKTLIAKKVVRIVAGLGSGMITNSIIKNNVHVSRIDQQVCVATASIAIGGIVAEKTGDHTDKMIDELIAGWNEFKS